MDPRRLDSLNTAPAEVGQKAPVAIVGVGASAGGLEALEPFFNRVPVDAGLAFVVVQHLSPDFKSLMDELLARYTRMPVHRVEDGMTVEPNTVYIIPPRKEMIIASGQLLLRDKDPHTQLALPIDMFFRSLAADCGPRAIAVVLSGTGSDGSRGIREVHEAGGLAVAQDPGTARFDGMPKSAIETGLVDLVLPPDEMAEAIMRYVRHAERELQRPEQAEPDPEDDVAQIVQLLRSEYGIDFRHYKQGTLQRRIERRLLLNQAMDLRAYTESLAQDRAELHNLYKDLLIGVTRFFRDKDAFDVLEREVLPGMLERTPPDQETRVWVAGCATGEEAYSLAIVLHELVKAEGKDRTVKVFATDVHRASLETAAAGIYDEQVLADVPPARREPYFKPCKDGTVQLAPEIRKIVVFAPHDLLRDAPFTRLDLISCRNLLIYLAPLAQKKVLSLFHFALKAGGLLFMGPSETPGELANEFDIADRHWKIFRKKRDIRLPPDLRLPFGTTFTPVRPRVRGDSSGGDLPLRRAQEALIQTFVPPSILVDSTHQVLHTFAGGGRFLTQPSGGRASLDILDLVDTELKLTLNGALHRAAKERTLVTYAGVRLAQSADERFRVTVRPVEQPNELWFVITLETDGPAMAKHRAAEDVNLDQMTRERIVVLERELQHTRENLQATLEEMEAANEELQATNEELVASNEELQSTNEELHSVNEELYTVNSEHQQKIKELTELTEDMENLFAASDVGTIFLDTELRVRKFTPEIGKTFKLIPRDIGRRIDNFAHTLSFPELEDRLTWVLRNERRFEAQVEDRAGRSYLLRMIPYRVNSGVAGVVVNLVDVSELRRTVRELAQMSKVFMDGADPILIEDLSGRIVACNDEACRAYGWTREDLTGQRSEAVVPDSEVSHHSELRARCHRGDVVRSAESVRRDRQGRTIPVLVTLSPFSDEGGQIAGIVSIAKDISKQKRAEEETRDAVKRRDEFLAMLSHELRTPLAAAQNACGLLNHPKSTGESRGRAATIVHRQICHMARLLEDLLDVSRIVRGSITIAAQPTDLGRTSMEAVEALHGIMEDRGQKLEIDIASEPLVVHGDRARLRQIQENLLNNASKFTPPGGRITLSVRREGAHAIIQVRDTGRGIAANLIESIFELFTQGERGLDRAEGGLGIGLTVVRQLVTLHGGTVVAESPGPGHGSSFTVRLPLARAEVPPEESAPKAPPVTAAGLRVLVVEDNADVREALVMALELDGFDVNSAGDGEGGLGAILARPPDIALVDIGLPGVDGYELARRVRSTLGRDRVRLIALTGYGSPDDRVRVRDAGFDAHLVKPVDHEALRKVLTSGSARKRS